MRNRFTLEFDKNVTKLVGRPLGRQIFEEQVMKNIDYRNDITIIFPDRIDAISSSFIQGFFEEVIRNIGIGGVENKVTIVSSIPNMKKLMMHLL